MDFSNVKIKLDTGCTYSTIIFRKLKDDDILVEDFKRSDIRNKVPHRYSYGVESGGKTHKRPKNFDEFMECDAIKFYHDISNFYIDDLKMPNLFIGVNYDRYSNILIGMDILSQFDIHIGESNITHKTTLIAVPLMQSDKSEYNQAIYEHFGIVESSSLLADNIRSTWRS
jgi:hypothetical protein